MRHLDGRGLLISASEGRLSLPVGVIAAICVTRAMGFRRECQSLNHDGGGAAPISIATREGPDGMQESICSLNSS